MVDRPNSSRTPSFGASLHGPCAVRGCHTSAKGDGDHMGGGAAGCRQSKRKGLGLLLVVGGAPTNTVLVVGPAIPPPRLRRLGKVQPVILMRYALLVLGAPQAGAVPGRGTAALPAPVGIAPPFA